jgi:GTP cyclohydrolase I
MEELTGSLRRLQQAAESEEQQISPKRSISRDGYGFRNSGISTPLIPTSTPDGPQHTQLADLNGLGWPGVFSLTLQQ